MKLMNVEEKFIELVFVLLYVTVLYADVSKAVEMH